MRWVLVILGCVLSVGSAAADALMPLRTIRPGDIILAEDLQRKPTNIPGALTHAAEVIGKEARVALYPGRPIRATDIGPPALVDRNQLVQLIFQRGALRIVTDGRALSRGAEGDRIRVMNLGSRSTIHGRISADGTIRVE